MKLILILIAALSFQNLFAKNANEIQSIDGGQRNQIATPVDSSLTNGLVTASITNGMMISGSSAGGHLSGTYPNPTVTNLNANNSYTMSNLTVSASLTAATNISRFTFVNDKNPPAINAQRTNTTNRKEITGSYILTPGAADTAQLTWIEVDGATTNEYQTASAEAGAILTRRIPFSITVQPGALYWCTNSGTTGTAVASLSTNHYREKIF